MQRETLVIEDLKIAYSITNPEGVNTVFFIHGNSTSAATWQKQMVSEQLSNYRLIAIDLPNHGSSDEINIDGDFSLPAIATIVGDAIKQLIDHKPYIICSVSLGTNIVAEMMKEDFSPAGLLMAGPCIIGEGFGMDKMFLPGADPSAAFAENVAEELVVKYANEVFLSTDKRDLEQFLADYNAVKGNFRSSFFATIAKGMYSDQIAILQQNHCAVCVVFGENERLVNTVYLDDAPINLWNKTIYKIHGASHLVNIDAPDAFNDILAAFAKDRFTTNDAGKQN